MRHNAGRCADSGYRIRWLSRTPRGHLFLVEHERCSRIGCRTWLDEKATTHGTRAPLAIAGEFRLECAGAAYPVVQTRSVLAARYTSYNRYDWSGERYRRTESLLAHRVDDFECGSKKECELAARQAFEHDETDRAVNIWRQVHHIDWI